MTWHTVAVIPSPLQNSTAPVQLRLRRVPYPRSGTLIASAQPSDSPAAGGATTPAGGHTATGFTVISGRTTSRVTGGVRECQRR